MRTLLQEYHSVCTQAAAPMCAPCLAAAVPQATTDRTAAQAAAAELTRLRATMAQDKERVEGLLSFNRQQVCVPG